MTTLITGGAGFIGSHLAEKLLSRNESIVILDNFNDFYNPELKRQNIEKLKKYNRTFTLVEADIRDSEIVHSIIADHKVEQIAHLAALGNVRASMGQAPLYMAVNTIGTMNLLEAAVQNDVKLFVLASTSSVYGKTEILPFIETDNADRPLASYPASKRAAEMLAHTYHHLHGLDVTVLRFFNVYGPSGRPDMMPMRLMEAAISGDKIPLFNNGDIHRDWTFIDDTVNGVQTALETPLGYEIINLGCGNPVSLTDFVEAIERYSGRKINGEVVPAPPSDPPITYCNNEKARRLLNFAPDISVFDGLKKTWEWFETWKGL